ncbi:IS1595 family transposase [Patescibacteria group bacterium]|nr:IS1595 family transposase [Patescibacteria group bacterium]
MKYSKLSDYRLKKLLRCFSDELTAVQAAKQMRVNRNTADRYYGIFRERIAEHQESQKQKFRGSVEIDESYFGSARRGDKRGRGVGRKIPVVGILKRNGVVYTEIIPDVSRKTLMPIIEKLVRKSKSNMYTDKWRSYDGLVLSGYKHYRINHSKEFARNHNHINGIESFWSYVKRKMRKHNGIPKQKFYLYLKESEFRFNNRGQNLYNLLKDIV